MVKIIKSSLAFLELYWGIRLQSLAIFVLSAVATAVIITGAYWSLYGFNRWKKEMLVAGQLITAAANLHLQEAAPQSVAALQIARQGGQYVCPIHGVVGLPRFNTVGQPLCPVGNEIMQFKYFSNVSASTQPQSVMLSPATAAAWGQGVG